MKKIKIFSILMLMLFVLTLNSVVGVNAEMSYTVTTDGNSSLAGERYTLTATRSLLSVDVSSVTIDFATLAESVANNGDYNVYVSLKYKFSSDAEGFETYAGGVTTDDVTLSGQNRALAGLVAPNTTAGTPWNLNEHTIYDNYTISTLKVGGYLTDIQTLDAIIIRLKGVVGTTFDLYDFVITTDGDHGFDTSDSGSSGETTEPTYEDYEGYTVETSNLTADGTTYTMTSTSASYVASFNNLNTATYKYVSIKYALGDGVYFESYANVKDSTGAEKLTIVAANITSAWNATSREEYSDYNITTIKIDSFTSSYVSFNKIRFSIYGAEGSTIQILDFIVTTDGIYNPEYDSNSPAAVSKLSVGSSNPATLTTNENEEQVITYSTSPGWNTFNGIVRNYNPNLTLFEFTYTASHAVTLCFMFNGVYESHITYPAGENKKAIIDLTNKEYNLTTTFDMKIYMDASVEVTEEKTITIHSMEFISKVKLEAQYNEDYTKLRFIGTIFSDGTEISTDQFITDIESIQIVMTLNGSDEVTKEIWTMYTSILSGSEVIKEARDDFYYSLFVLKGIENHYGSELTAKLVVTYTDGTILESQVKNIKLGEGE